MIFAFFLLVIAFCSSLTAIIMLRPLGIKIGLTDRPNARKNHVGHIPLIGGISVYIGLFVTSLIILVFYPHHVSELMTYLFASLLIVLTGVLDDRFDLSVRIRIIVQIVITSIMMFVAGDALFNVGNLFGFGDINMGYFAYPLTVIIVIGSISAYNMVDGIDGLIGGISVATFIPLSVLFYLSEDIHEMFFCLLCLAVLTPYLLYNLQLTKYCSKKIFMGDAGSMFLGLTVVWLIVIGGQKHSSGLSADTSAFSPIIGVWILALPLLDMISIMLRRIKKGFSPFKPDRDHLHHIFMRAGFSSRETLIIITIISLLLSSIGVLTTLYSVPDYLQLGAFLSLLLAYNYSLSRVWVLVTIYRGGTTVNRLSR
ncbi:UDP-N-acetylglucosamine--undecaprenyl-phosphate N-acetylglucosaminephosphotransferase [Psychromonas ossibalaenae]|uniref:UDP-N-acetylglucosamine--undecaprenyl-phosphate N-acetylglucosaminephosphotransferase n=1 Tax=Psychromonas ossibalaenae TaxID=444922 RepID=UPI0003611088|nr:UDP-N-acetylglucosamine--undecaprenyl-phosphate N-acetylglucosaminephosphotransferase [Psychromonas ossibalaenae]